MMHMILIAQACQTALSRNPAVPDILRNLCESCIVKPELASIARYIDRVFDEEASEDSSRFVVKSGVDEVLDHKKRIHNGLPDLLFQLAKVCCKGWDSAWQSATLIPNNSKSVKSAAWAAPPQAENTKDNKAIF